MCWEEREDGVNSEVAGLSLQTCLPAHQLVCAAVSVQRVSHCASVPPLPGQPGEMEENRDISLLMQCASVCQ